VLCPLLARFMLVSPRLYGARQGTTQVLKAVYRRTMGWGAKIDRRERNSALALDHCQPEQSEDIYVLGGSAIEW
jgi:hypothetical protein